MDFTLITYHKLLESLKAAGYTFQPYAEYLERPVEKVVILRHDVDKRPENSLVTAQIENELGIRGTYYFRIVKSSYNEEIILKIHSLGHEIGYHYEDISLVPGTRHPIPFLIEKAILSFETSLSKLRELTPITTICMHGSPLSRYDNRLLWEYYDYRDYGIIGEPYFDTDFSKVLYLTDTGRTWNNKYISLRDKPTPNTDYRLPNRDRRKPGELTTEGSNTDYRSTSDIIKATQNNHLGSQIMLTIHPQRWTNNTNMWLQEIVHQNIKNTAKWLILQLNA